MTDTSPHDDFSLKETKPSLDKGKVLRYKLTSTYEYAQRKQYLYVRVVKAKNLVAKDISGSGRCDPYAEVWLGSCKGTTRHFEENSNPEWNQVFAFSRGKIQANMLEVTVKDNKYLMKDDFIGCVLCDLCVVPKRAPPDSPVSPRWYRLEDRKGKKLKGEVMLAVWWGIQADEVFPEAWHSDDASVSKANALANSRSKIYPSPKLWYLRVNVIEGYLKPIDTTRFPEAYVKATLGHQTLSTKISTNSSVNPLWNEDLMFVAAEPFEEPLILSLQDKVAPNHDEVLGTCSILLQDVDRRLDNKAIKSIWFNLKGEKKDKFGASSRICMRICLEGGYHVFDESTHYSSDFRSTSKHLWRKSIGVLDVRILGATGLSPMKTIDGRASTDAYCVAKYGRKWVRTRTIRDSFTPKWNEEYTWEVFDLCTFITIGVFDNSSLQDRDDDDDDKSGGARDSRMGKVRLRLANLETDRVYTHSYPLLVLHPSGVKKMGEIHLAVRFTCSSLFTMMHMYSQPLLPKMHYIHPLTVTQLDTLRHQATQIVSMRLSRAEPPLRKEVVEYMLDVDSHMWSLRRSKAIFYRVMGVLGGLIAIGKWFSEIYSWKNPVNTIVFHILFFTLVLYPVFVLPFCFLSLFLLGMWNYRYRPRQPSHIDTRLSQADVAHPDELDEEFDTFPTSLPGGVILKMRYDRLRSISGRIQKVAGDLATQGERLQSLLSWRDPRATTVFLVFSLVAAIVLYATPFYVVIIQIGLSVLRHPRFRNKIPSVTLNFVKRLHSRTESML